MQQFNASTTTHAQPDGPVAMYDAASLQPPPHAFPATYVPAGGAASGGEWAAAPLASEQAPSTLMDDARLALLVTLSVVVVHLLPLDTLLQGRLPAQLEAFPYTMLLVRALSAGVLVVLGRRFLLGSI